MGKIRTRFIGIEEIEKKQKKEQKIKSQERKQEKIKVRAPGQKGGERSVMVEQDKESETKLEKAKKIIEEEPKKEVKKKAKKARKRGKNYLLAKKEIEKIHVDKSKPMIFSLEEAVSLLKKISYAKFDETVEIHIKTSKKGLRGDVDLPHSTGKKIRVKIVDDTVLDNIEEGKIDFDVLITHPSFMPKIAKLAKILGPKGLMPNPKAGTISENPEETVKKYEKGVIKWKTEPKYPLIHQIVGKISYDEKKIIENIKSFINSIGKNQIMDLYIKSSMSPSIKINIDEV
jgi:large subunit ribosomal protein L1